jgi:bifunctional non-homologous end joining protein LigD
VVPPVFDDVDGALATSEQFDLEGIVVKDPRSPYRRGARSESWLKVKLTRTQEVVHRRHPARQGGRARRSGRCCSASPDPTVCSTRDGRHGFSDATLRR